MKTKLCLLLTLCVPALAWAQFERPKGFYLLDQNIAPPNTQSLSLPFIDGFIVRMPWGQAEPSQGQYDFFEVDAALSRLLEVNLAEQPQKNLVVQILSSRAPDHWVNLPGTLTYTGVNRLAENACPTGEPPPCFETFESLAPWDSTGRTAMDALLQALANHPVPLDHQGTEIVRLADHPLMYAIMVPVPGGRGVREGCVTSLADQGLCDPLPSLDSWTLEGYADAISASVASVMGSFPEQYRYLEYFNFLTGQGGDLVDVAGAVFEVLEPQFIPEDGPPQIGFFRENLSCSQPSADSFPLAQAQNDTYNMLQFVDSFARSFTGSPGLAACTEVDPDTGEAIAGPDVAIEYGMAAFQALYFEIYTADATHEPFHELFEALHGLIHRDPIVFLDGFENLD